MTIGQIAIEEDERRSHWPPRATSLSRLARLPGSFRRAVASAVENRRLFVLLPFDMIAGLIVYAALPAEPVTAVYAVASVVLIAAITGSFWQQSQYWFRISIQFGALWLGFCLLPLHALAFGTPMLSFPAYGTYEASVDEVISSDGDDRRLVVSNIVALEDARPVDLRRARLLLPDDVDLQPGDRLRARLRFAPIPGPVLPGSHDGQFHSYFIGIGAYGSAIGSVDRIETGDPINLGRQVQALRDGIGTRIDAVLSGDTAAIGKAMVVGDQSGISDEVREVMAASGLAHIYSISGLHLSIVAGGVFWLVRLILASVSVLAAWPVKKIAAIAGLVAAFLYLLLAGGVDNVPAFRSTLMLALIFGAVLAGRRALTMRNVAIAAIVIILIDPASVFRPSFQLSFAAVVGLIGIYEMPRATGKPSGRIGRLFGIVTATAWTSFIAGLATMLFSAYHFQQTSPLSVIGNVLALPFVGLVIMPFGALSVLAMPLDLEAPFLQVMGWGIDRMVDVAELVAAWSKGITANPLLAGWTLVLGLGAIAWFAFFQNRWRLLGPAIALPLILVFGMEPRPDILISDTTQAVAVRDGDGMALVTGRADSFAVDVWSQTYQTEITETHPDARCDSLGCIVETSDFSLAVVMNAAAFAEDCGQHDLIIARVYPPTNCVEGSEIIGPGELRSQGVHWLHWNVEAGRFDIRPAIEHLNRPWRASQR